VAPTFGPPAETVLHRLQSGGQRHITGDGNHRMIGHVVRLVERRQRRAGRLVDGLDGRRRAAIGMAVGHHLAESLECQEVGLRALLHQLRAGLRLVARKLLFGKGGRQDHVGGQVHHVLEMFAQGRGAERRFFGRQGRVHVDGGRNAFEILGDLGRGPRRRSLAQVGGRELARPMWSGGS
jgi:hypothetical protein